MLVVAVLMVIMCDPRHDLLPGMGSRPACGALLV